MVQAIAWSYELLPPGQAALFRRLGIFSGGARLPEIEAVCRPEIDLGIDTLDGLAALVDQSLVQVRRFGESRYEMLHVLSEFARSRLSDDELSELGERHAGHLSGARGGGRGAIIEARPEDLVRSSRARPRQPALGAGLLHRSSAS